MATTARYVLGSLLIVLLVLSGVIYISLGDSVRIRVDEDKSCFYAKKIDSDGKPYGRFLKTGCEHNKLFDGSKLIYRHAKDVELEYFYFDGSSGLWEVYVGQEEPSKLKTIRTTPYYNGATIIDTYEFDGREDDVELFPISHTIEILNGNTCGKRGCIYQWEIRDLFYEGETKDITSPMSYGMRMKAEWDDGYYFAKVYQQRSSDKQIVKYRVTEDHQTISVRFFDPPAPIDSCQIINSAGEYTLNQSVSSDTWCFVINTANVHLDCQGYTIDYSLNGSNRAIYTNNGVEADNLTIENCVIQSNNVSAQTAIDIGETDDVVIYNNTINSTIANGISRGIYVDNGTNINISDNSLYEIDGNSIEFDEDTENVVIDGNYMDSRDDEGFKVIYVHSNITDLNVTNNEVHYHPGGTGQGILLDRDPVGSFIIGSRVIGNEIHYTGTSGAIVVDTSVQNTIIENNIFNNSHTSGYAIGEFAGLTSLGYSINSNNLTGAQGIRFATAGVENVTLFDNIITSNQNNGFGINVDTGGTNFNITSNTITIEIMTL